MTITGKNLIAGQWFDNDTDDCFYPFSPAQHKRLEQSFENASESDVDNAAKAAHSAFVDYRKTTPLQRAQFLETIAEQIMALGDDLTNVTHMETALPLARLNGERTRTVSQLRLFADFLRNPQESKVIDPADAGREPLPKPQIALQFIAIGPVAVFGASNFPYAFSTAGGDTASALAAGCPVIVKGHPAHPGTSELMATAIVRAIEICDMPAGVFSLLQGHQPQLSHQLVKHELIKAVGFTGSKYVAMSLQQTINQRVEQIPLYGELGSTNPQFLLEDMLNQSSNELAQQLVDSMMMGQGQFCTSPGIWLLPTGNEQFIEQVKVHVMKQSSAPMLTPGILDNFNTASEQLSKVAGVSEVATGTLSENFHTCAKVVATDCATFIKHPSLQEEVFGPFAIIVTYDGQEQLLTLVNQLEGQLTASIHGTSADLEQADELIENLGYRVGRLIFNQMPTGVELSCAMNHGGPFPASTDIRSTSVGTEAINRFLRPLCVQNGA